MYFSPFIIRNSDNKKIRAEILDTVEKRGVEKGENKLGLLMKKLFAAKRYADADEAATDEIKRNQLYREFGIQ